MAFNTGNPIGSTDARDLSDNAENFDKALGTTAATWVDRFGVTRDSFEGRLAKGSFYRVGTFAAGYTLTNMRQTLEYNGHEYSWAGTFPKVVAAGATPETSGGIGAGAWVDRTDLTLRSDINVVVKRFASVAEMVADSTLTIGRIAETMSYHDGWAATATKPVGSNRYEIVAASTGTADGGSFITLNNGLQAKGLFIGGVDVCQFGAKGDDYTNDYQAIQNAHNFSEKVIYPSGLTYKALTDITVAKAHILADKSVLLKFGIQVSDSINIRSTKISKSGLGGDCIYSVAGATLGSIYIDNVEAYSATNAFNFMGDGTTGSIGTLHILNCNVHDISIRGVNASPLSISHCEVSSNNFENIGSNVNAEAIRLGVVTTPKSFKGMKVCSNSFKNVVTTDNNECHAIIVMGSHAIIKNNTIENVYNGSPIGSPDAAEAIYTKCAKSTIQSNHIINGARTVEGAITVKGTDDPLALQYGSFCKIKDNIIEFNGDANYIGRGINCMVSGCDISGNDISGSLSDGIGVFTLYNSAYYAGGINQSIVGNRVFNVSGSGIVCRRSQKNVLIQGNIIDTVGGNGIQYETPDSGTSSSYVNCYNIKICDNEIANVSTSNQSAIYINLRNYTNLKSLKINGNAADTISRQITFAGTPANVMLSNLDIKNNTFTNYSSSLIMNGFPINDGVTCTISGNIGLVTRQYGYYDFVAGATARKDVYFTPMFDNSTDYHVMATMSLPSSDSYVRQYLSICNQGANYIVLNINSTDAAATTVPTACRVYYEIRHKSDKLAK